MSQGTVDGFLKDTDVTLAADSNLFVPSQHAVKTYVDTLVASSTPLSNIPVSTYSTVQHLMNFSLSAGVSSGGNIVVSATPNAVDVSSGTGFIRAVDSNVATLSFFDWSASPAISVPSNTTRYIGVDYNGGAPIVISQTVDVWDLDTQFPLGVAVNEAGTLYISVIPWVTGDNMSNVIERFDSLATVARDNRVGGIILSNVGTRNVAVSAGAILSRMSEFTVSAIDTSAASTFDAYYRNGLGGFAKLSAQTQWNNSQYDDGTGVLASLTALHYTSRWFYVMTDGSLAMLFGRNNDASLATALNDGTPSSAPDRITQEGMLIGRFIIQQGTSTPDVTQTVFETNFSAASVTDFSDLSGFATPSQGGTGVQNNDASTITITGAFPTTLTITAPTSITLPTSGTLTTTSNNLGVFASTTSAQLASVLSDETGTGLAVFNTSPTLVTPALGTPSSAVLTNATGLPISTGVSGLGAGIATFLATPSSANLASAVTDETGAGALVFANSPVFTTPNIGSATGSISGNAGTATALQTPRTINGVSFDGTANITVTAAAGTLTGTTLAAGVTASSLTSFGTSPTFVTPVLGTPTSGTLTNCTGLPISTGVSGLAAGIATFLATPSSANLASAVTDETGTGALMFATSPTLVTPALGTPSSGVLTNCTGLPVAGGGTGDASFTAYAVVCGGTTSTNPLQSVAGVGTAGQVLTSNGAGALPTFQSGSQFTSADQAITAAGALTLAHGLGAIPHHVHAYLVNQTAEQNYTVGDLLAISIMADASGGANRGISLVPDATNLNIRFGSAAATFQIVNKTTGAVNAITNANWKIRFYATVNL